MTDEENDRPAWGKRDPLEVEAMSANRLSPVTESCKYRCWMQSIPGPYEQYDGHVDVWCRSDDWSDVFTAAVAKLKRTAFPDRTAACWKMIDFELVRTRE